MNTTTTRRTALAAVLAPLVLALGACAGDDHSSMGSMGGSGPSSAASGTADHDRADVMFSAMMVPHHEQAVEMAELVPSRTEDAGVRDLAERIRAAQQPEIDTMKVWLEQWGAGGMADMGDHSGHSMDGMMSADDLRELGDLRGAEFDRRWLEMMVEHHEGAIDMAEDVLRSGTHAGTRELATAIIEAQRREIDEMRGMLDG